ncbi:hypothetical protein B0I35DRAFT_409101 [Stachybotrys elegans]|uniref:Uncharacterized protein n=1 Tax=Stachybotrys elegans TaxID=80388 RepID=A0A8K0SPI9_9HYPO|nr:hypothetical protein B0I35DRAFT_409101 [Stachybotrys elegans]
MNALELDKDPNVNQIAGAAAASRCTALSLGGGHTDIPWDDTIVYEQRTIDFTGSVKKNRKAELHKLDDLVICRCGTTLLEGAFKLGGNIGHGVAETTRSKERLTGLSAFTGHADPITAQFIHAVEEEDLALYLLHPELLKRHGQVTKFHSDCRMPTPAEHANAIARAVVEAMQKNSSECFCMDLLSTPLHDPRGPYTEEEPEFVPLDAYYHDKLTKYKADLPSASALYAMTDPKKEQLRQQVIATGALLYFREKPHVRTTPPSNISWLAGNAREIVLFELMRSRFGHAFNRYAWTALVDMNGSDIEYHADNTKKLGYLFTAMAKLLLTVEDQKAKQWWEDNSDLLPEIAINAASSMTLAYAKDLTTLNAAELETRPEP